MGKTPSIKIALVGCGAIADLYANVLRRTSSLIPYVAADLNEKAAQDFAARHKIPHWVKDYHDALEKVDAAILCLPNDLHAPVAIDILAQRVPVLCEKPLATTEDDARRMIATARSRKTVLAVANVRRYYWTSQWIKKLVADGTLGRLLYQNIEEGEIFSWPTRSGFFFDRKRAGGGVLLDMGSHLLDLMLWWVGDYPSSVFYADDDYGGVEADSEVHLKFAGGGVADLKVSRLRNLKNRIELVFEGGKISYNPSVLDRLTLSTQEGGDRIIKGPRMDFNESMQLMLMAFAGGVRGESSDFIDAEDVLPSLRLIGECYRTRTCISAPWL